MWAISNTLRLTSYTTQFKFGSVASSSFSHFVLSLENVHRSPFSFLIARRIVLYTPDCISFVWAACVRRMRLTSQRSTRMCAMLRALWPYVKRFFHESFSMRANYMKPFDKFAEIIITDDFLIKSTGLFLAILIFRSICF